MHETGKITICVAELVPSMHERQDSFLQEQPTKYCFVRSVGGNNSFVCSVGGNNIGGLSVTKHALYT